MTKDSMFSENVQKTKLWNKFVKWYKETYGLIIPLALISNFIKYPFEFQEGVFRKFLLEECGYAIGFTSDMKKNEFYADAESIDDQFETEWNESSQKASEEIILKCMDL